MIEIKKKYLPLFQNDSRYFIVTGGRGSGKSFALNTFLLLLTYESGHVILFTRYTLVSAHISIIPEFTEKIDMAGLQGDFSITKDEIINVRTGSKILFKGIKTSSGTQTANLKSLSGVTTFVLDEAEELVDEDTFDKIDLSVRNSGRQNRVILLLNPTTKEHFIYQRFFEQKGIPSGVSLHNGDTTYIHTTYLDNEENLSDSFLLQVKALQQTNPKKYEHTILGGWLDKAEGVVFSNWKFGQFNPDNLLVSFGQDYGFSVDPTTLIEVAIDKRVRRIYVKEHLYKPGLDTSAIAAINKSTCGKNLIVADSAEPRLIEELKHRGCNITKVEKPPGSINDGIAMMLDYEIVVDPNSHNIAKELNNYVYSDKKSGLVVDKFNHAIDSIRYNVYHNLSNPYKGKYHVH